MNDEIEILGDDRLEVVDSEITHEPTIAIDSERDKIVRELNDRVWFIPSQRVSQLLHDLSDVLELTVYVTPAHNDKNWYVYIPMDRQINPEVEVKYLHMALGMLIMSELESYREQKRDLTLSNR